MGADRHRAEFDLPTTVRGGACPNRSRTLRWAWIPTWIPTKTPKDTHVAAVIATTGALLDTRSFPTTVDGYRQLPAWACAFGRLQRAGVECTGSYGAALTRYLHRRRILHSP
jgi:hypothetical protein